MELSHLRYFLAVVDHGSINAASATLAVSQPTISQALRALERELRIPLFNRIGRGMVLTSAGHTLVGPARKILRDLGTAAGAVTDADGLLRGRLDIRVHPAMGVSVVSELVTRFHRYQPRVSIEIDALHDETRVAHLLRNAVCELVVTHLPYPQAPAEEGEAVFETVLLGLQEYWMAFPPGYEVPENDPIAWEQIDFPVVTVPQGGRHADGIFASLTPVQQARRPAVVLENREARLAFALAGVAPVWIERSLAAVARGQGGEVRAISPALTTPYGLVFDPGQLSPAAAWFVKLARAQASAVRSSSMNAWPAGESWPAR
jgi:DNA-binding transcriptional LysR family regulator